MKPSVTGIVASARHTMWDGSFPRRARARYAREVLARTNCPVVTPGRSQMGKRWQPVIAWTAKRGAIAHLATFPDLRIDLLGADTPRDARQPRRAAPLGWTSGRGKLIRHEIAQRRHGK